MLLNIVDRDPLMSNFSVLLGLSLTVFFDGKPGQTACSRKNKKKRFADEPKRFLLYKTN
jgi:hypothetical protein